MDENAVKAAMTWAYAGAGVGIGLAVIGAGVGIGKLAAGIAEGVARQPSASEQIAFITEVANAGAPALR